MQGEREGSFERESARPSTPLIVHHRENCTECWGCVRHCPAKAIRVVDGHSEVILERCVSCGACVTACGSAGHSVRDDLDAVRDLLAGERPVVALLASEYVAALHPSSRAEIERRLRSVGFAWAETTVLGEELVAAAYERVHRRTESVLPSLRSTCPVALEWVRRYHPQFTGALVPIVPPYIAHARLVRAMHPQVSVAYVSPCWARKDEVFEDGLTGAVDVAIGFDELERLLEETPPDARPASVRARCPEAVKQLSLTDGFPRSTVAARDMTARDVVTVRGLADLDRLLTAIMRGETAPAVVDMLNCEGCIDGPCVAPEMSVYAKRAIDEASRERQKPPAVDSRTLLSGLPAIDLTRVVTPRPVSVREPSDTEIDAVLAAGEFASRADVIDCGACGYATCIEHAAAICLGDSNWSLCFPLQKRLLERERSRLVRDANTDDLTALANRRSFERRLAEEVSRARRYHTPLSLVLLDLDRFKAVNDTLGHAAGDMLLSATGTLLPHLMRDSDLAARLGGDEFALLLPETPKTEAWAVAERVRAAIGRLTVELPDGRALGVTASLGVATLSDAHPDPRSLLDAADAALYRAKHAGCDRVELAAG